MKFDVAILKWNDEQLWIPQLNPVMPFLHFTFRITVIYEIDKF